MNNNDSNIKNNLIRLGMFLTVALLSAFLLMTAINMLNLSNAGAGGGEGGNQSSSAGENKDSSQNNQNSQSSDNSQNSQNDPNIPPKVSSDLGDFDNEYRKDWKERVEKRRAEKGNTIPGRDYSYGDIPESLIPGEGNGTLEDTPNIDISGDQEMPDLPFGSGEPGKTIVMGDEKQPHVPAFEVLGYPNYPFLKVMVMDNYNKNHWTIADEKPEVKINWDKQLDENYSANSVKIKPIVASNGYLPVLSGDIEFKYRSSVDWYENSGTYYAKDPVDDFYSMDYQSPPDIERLKYANTDDSYPYSVTVPYEIDLIADRIIEDSNSDYDVIKAVEKYLSAYYVLNNEKINNYGDKDGILAFLQGHNREGNTLDFMSAYAFILRAAGIPCRLAIGYRINPELPYQIVYKDQAYIYPEIKFADYGWVPMDVFGFDPAFTPPDATITEITSASPEAKRGTSFIVKGTVKDTKGTMLDDMSVLIYVKQSKTESTLSYARADVNNGYFELECDIKHNTGAGKYQVIADLLENDIYRTSTSDPEMRVVTDTMIEMDTDDTVVGDSFKISGKLLDNYSKDGVNGLAVDVEFPGIDTFESIISGEGGVFYKAFHMDKFNNLSPEKNLFFLKSYNLPYKLEFKGTDIFFPTYTESRIVVWRILWLRIVLTALALIVIIVLPFVVLALRKRRGQGGEEEVTVLTLEAEAQGITIPVAVETPVVKKKAYIELSIEFPQIKEGYPDVWGLNEELTVRFSDSSKNMDEIKDLFSNKGVYRISVSAGDEIIAKRDINIVDYREEVISIGKGLLTDIALKFTSIDNKMTLREILELIKPAFTTMKYMIVEELFRILEKAVYSMNDITRDDYEMFFICVHKYRNED